MADKRFEIHIFLIVIVFFLTTNTPAQIPSWEWARSVHTNDFEVVHDVVADPATNDVYIVGTWKDDLSAIFPAGANPSTDFSAPYGGEDGFVAKYDEDGNFIWAFKAGGDHNDEIVAISMDAAGNIYIAGTFGQDINYFSGTSTVTAPSTLSNPSKNDYFIAKYNPDGNFIWVRRSQSNGDDVAGIAVDVNGTSLFATGIYKDVCSFGPLSATSLYGNFDVFLIKYDLDGNEQWLISGGSNHEDFAYGISADESNVFIAGHFHGDQMEFTSTGGATVSTIINVNSGKDDIFLASYDLNGVFNWSQHIASNDNDACFDIAADTDNIYITGAIDDITVFPSFVGNPVTTSTNRDIFISSHTKTNGNTVWAYSIPCTDGGDEYGRAIDIDYRGDLYITGFYKQDITFPGPVTLSSIGSEESFVASYSQDGTFIWAKNVGSNGKDYGYGISTGSKGSIYTVGSYENELSLDLLNLPDDGNHNGYLGKLQEPCSDAIGGTISATQTVICIGEIVLLTLSGHSGDIAWQSSPAGMDSWVPIPGATIDSVKVSPTIDTDYRAFIRSGTCNPDSSNVIPVSVFEVPKANPGPDGEACGNVFGLQAIPSVGSGQWTKTAGPGVAVFIPSANNPIATVAVSLFGTYEFTWTETNGICSDDSVVKVRFTEPPVSDAGPDAEICIRDGSYAISGSTSANGTILWTTSGDGTFDGDATDNPTYTIGSETGTVTLTKTVSSAGSCADSVDAMVLTLTPLPVSDAGPDAEICISDGSFIISGSTSANGTILWTTSGDGTFDDATEDNPTYTIGSETGTVNLTKTVSSAGSCADSVDAMVLTLTPLPESDAGPDTEICISDGSFIISGSTSANGTILWTTSGDGTFDDATEDNPTYTIGSETGTVTLTKTVSSAGSCADSVDAMVLTLTPLPESDAGPDAEICIRDGSYAISGSTSANGAILWTTSGDGTFDDDATDNPTYTIGSESGTVTLTKTVSSAGSCADSVDAMVLTLTPLPVSDAGPDAEICISDGSFIISGSTSANGTILWTTSGDGTFDDATEDNPTYTIGSESGTVTLTKTVSSAGSCADSVDAMVLTLTPLPESDAGPDAEICIGDGSFIISGSTSANGAILWTTSGDGTFDDATEDNPTYTIGSETGTVTLTKTVSSAGSCADSVDAMLLTLTPLPESDAGPDAEICLFDGTFTLSGTTSSNGMILWSASGDGTFDDAATDNPTYTIGSETGSVTLTKTVTGMGSCADSVDAMILTIATQPVSDAGPNDEVCISDGTYTLTGTTSADGTILWSSSGDGSFDDAATDNPTYTIGSETGSVTLTKTVTGPGACGDSIDAMILILTQQPISDAGPNDEVCISDGTYTLTGTTSADGTILWSSSGDGSFDDAATDNPSYTFGSETGTVTLTKTVTGAGSCADSVDAMVLTLTPLPESDAGPDAEICISDGSFIISGSTSANGTILWTTSGDGTFDDAATDNPTYSIGSETGTVTLTKTVSRAGSCADSVDAMVLILTPSPVANAGSGGRTCRLEYQLGAIHSSGSGEWTKTSGPGNASFTPSLNDPRAMAQVSEPGQYLFTWTVSNGICTDTSSVIVQFIEHYDVNAGVDGSVCGLTFDLKAVPQNGSGYWILVSGPGNVTFSPSDTLFNASVTADTYGMYEFQWNETLGDCTGNDIVEVTFYYQPTAYAGPDQVLEFVFATRLEGNIPEFGTGRWTLLRGSGQLEDENDPGTEVTGLSLGENEFVWSIITGVCEEVTDNVIITVRDIQTPTVITPNNDGLNDNLEFPGVDLQEGSELIIYNRWGTEVYHNNNYKNDWSGKDHKGRDLISDTYFYVLKLPPSRIIKSFVEIKR